jgi:hypothetical protein
MDAMNGDTYRAIITREDGHWLADVPSLPGAHTYARSLPTLDQAVREVVVLAADLPAALLGISPQSVSQLTARAS